MNKNVIVCMAFCGFFSYAKSQKVFLVDAE